MLNVGTWVQVVTSDEYDGMTGPIDWIDPQRVTSDNHPYGVDLPRLGSLFFAEGEVVTLPQKPESDPRLTRLVVFEDGDTYLLLGLDVASLDAQEQELRETDAEITLTQFHRDGLITSAEADRLAAGCQI